MLQRLVDEGMLGRKTGRGFHNVSLHVGYGTRADTVYSTRRKRCGQFADDMKSEICAEPQMT